MFEKMNLTPTGINVLILLARSPGKEFYIRELARLAKVSVGGCHNVLAQLDRMGFIERRKSGRNVYYRVIDRNPSIRFFKIFANIQELDPLVKRLKDRCRKVVLFGSAGNGEDTQESDIDVLIVTEKPDEVRGIVQRKIGDRTLRPVIVAPGELLAMKAHDPSFYEETGKGIVLWRDTDE